MECRKNYVASKLSALGFQMWMHLCCKPNSECCTAMYCNTNCITTLPYQIAIIYFILALSLRINWRASVNLLIDQKSQLWCQHCISSPWHMLNCFSSNLRVWCLIASPNPHLQQSILVVCVCVRALGLSLRINWRASVNLLIDQKSQLWCQHCFSSPWHMLNCFFWWVWIQDAETPSYDLCWIGSDFWIGSRKENGFSTIVSYWE